MEKGFDKEGFMEWLKKEFPGVVETRWNYDLVENIIDYGFKHETVSKDQLCYWISDMLPELEFLEVAKFIEDEHLTTGTLDALGR